MEGALTTPTKIAKREKLAIISLLILYHANSQLNLVPITESQRILRHPWYLYCIRQYISVKYRLWILPNLNIFSTCIRPYFSFNARILSTILLSSNIRLTVRSKTFCMDIPTSQSVTQISCFSGPASFFHFAICNTVVKFSVLNQIVNDSLF